jgi:hypothetical protein
MTNQTNVNSTLIQSIGYNPLNEQLSVILKAQPAMTYVYRGVSRSTANQLVESPSKGQFFNKNIRGRFPTTKVAA